MMSDEKKAMDRFLKLLAIFMGVFLFGCVFYTINGLLQSEPSSPNDGCYINARNVMSERAQCRQWYANRKIESDGGFGVPIYDEYMMEFYEFCNRKHPLPDCVL